ncbi:hypothetical protein [Streptomyces sp. 11x1]|uniref:hypothetical protein n=1 Tax=Streptomyces sp. 11x1 TaxID=3038642 RepID=UPI00292F8820|nr:hypothetical protein [Streptomyces sp. 11x1]WNZ10724.1 hypothetical protein P8T65_26260 [Streptomyces sp. 11x1]
MPELSPHRARWRRWAAQAARSWAARGRPLPLLAREACWERPLTRAERPQAPEGDATRDIVRSYVAAYLGDERAGGVSERAEELVMGAFQRWLDPVAGCVDVCHDRARRCYDAERLGDRYREAKRAASGARRSTPPP